MVVFEDENISVVAEVHLTGFFTFHSLETGEVECIDEDEIKEIKEHNGKTLILYFTGWDDCPVDGFYAKESVDELRQRLNDVREKLKESIGNYYDVCRLK